MIPFKATDSEGETFMINVPDSWDELSFRMYHQMGLNKDKLNDPITLLSILSGKDYGYIYSFPVEELYAKVSPYLEFLSTPLNIDEQKMPDEILIDDVLVKIPKDLKVKTYGQKLMASQIVKRIYNEKVTMMASLPALCAIYLSAEYYKGKFDSDKVSEFEELLWDQPAKDVYSIGSFFLTKSLQSFKLKVTGLQHHTRPKRFWQKFINWKNSATSIRLTPLQEVTS